MKHFYYELESKMYFDRVIVLLCVFALSLVSMPVYILYENEILFG